jgi:hypothetical protein
LTYKTKGRQQEAKGKGDSAQKIIRKIGQEQADGASACCLGALAQ